MKYIDSERLRAEIKFAKSVYDNPKRVVYGVADACRQDGRAAMCDDIQLMIQPGNGTTAYSTNISVDDKGYVDIVYQIQNIWSINGTSGSQIIDSGELTLDLSYRLANTNNFTPKTGTPTTFTVTA